MPHDPAHHHRTANAVAGLHQEIAWTHPEAAPHVAIDIEERDGELVVHVDLPGVHDQDVTVTCDGRDLSIRGVRTAEEVGHVYHRERLFGTFERTVTLKHAVDETAMRASYRGGVLEIRLPRAKAQTATTNTERER